MLVGDVLEVVAALLLAIGALLIAGSLVSLAVGAGSALLVIGSFLGYAAQVYADVPVRTVSEESGDE